jgi:hypothetical protein
MSKQDSKPKLPENAKLVAELYFPAHWDDADTPNEISAKVDEVIQALKDDQRALAYVVLNRKTNGNEEEPFDFDVWRDQLIGEVGDQRVKIISGDKDAMGDFELYVVPNG